MEGDIVVDTSPGAGSRFSVVLPNVLVDSDNTEQPKPAVIGTEQPAGIVAIDSGK
jgi:hypothetical protein